MSACGGLVLGIGLLWRPAVRSALAGTIVWALAVWWLGEGLGGLLTGTASPVIDAPAAALIYVIIAILAWPRSTDLTSSRIGPAARGLWVLIWAGAAYLMLQPANLAPRALSRAIGSQADGEPGWIVAMNWGVASAIGPHGALISVVLAVIFVFIAVGVFVPSMMRVVIFAATGLALLIWVVGQDFGGILTGQATDLNTGPLLILLAAAYLPLRRSAGELGEVGGAVV